MNSRLFKLCLFSLLAIPAITSCGGGSNGPATPIPTPTPQNKECSAQTYTPNYVSNPDSNFRLLHWPSFPLRVFFVQDAENTPERRALAVEGFNKWVKATNNGVTYQVVSKESDANVTVRFFVFKGGANDELGNTKISYYTASNTISFAAITLGLTGDARNDGITATHEFGHAISFYGHSPNPEDIMYFQGNDALCGCITPADLNTFLTAYCGDFNKNINARTSPHRGELKTVTIQ